MAHVLQGDVAVVYAVYLDAARVRLVEAAQQVDGRGFARAGFADQPDHLAGLGREVQPFEDRVGLVVAEAHIVELHLAHDGVRLAVFFRVLLLFGVNDLEDALRARHRPAEPLIQLPEPLQRHVDHADERVHADKVAERQFAPIDHVAAVRPVDERAHAGKQDHGAENGKPLHVGLDARVAQFRSCACVKLVVLVILFGERFDDADAGQRLVQVHVEPRPLLPDPEKHLRDRLPEHAAENQDERHGSQHGTAPVSRS